MSVNMANNNHNDDLRRRMEVREQNSRAQRASLENIQQILAQFLKNHNNNNTIGSNYDEEEENDNERPKMRHSKEGSSIDVEVLKGIQAQITSLTQRDEMKKVAMTCPYPLEWVSVPYPPKSSHLHCTHMTARARQTNHHYFRSKINIVIDNDAIMSRLFIGTLKG